MSLVYFITHPNVIINPAIPVPQWPLSDRGRERMTKLLAQPWIENIGAIYCSTEQKAIDGAEILARHRAIGYEMLAELGEIDRSSTGYLPPDEHEATASLFFAHPGESVRGWETAQAAQQRIVQAVASVIEHDHGSRDIAIVSHGAVGTLYLCHLKGRPISLTEGPPGTSGGCFFCFDALSRTLVHEWRPIDG